nr:TadE family type IV pilus minor pilin [Nocardioides perillae]
MGLPLLLSVTVGLVWLLAAGVAQVRAVDAARETARALARGDDRAAAVALGQRVATSGALIRVDVGGGRVRVVATAPVAGPGGVFAVLPTVQVEATAVAVVEDDGGGW